VNRRSFAATTFWAGLGFVLLLGLGTWQVERLKWKEGLIAERQAWLAAAPVPAPRTLEQARALAFHPVRVEGRFLNDREMPVATIARNGQAGYDIVTPFLLGGRTVLLVDRGFVPPELKEPQSRAAGLIEGPTEVTGLVRLDSGKPNWFVPDNVPTKNTWYYMDVGAMGKAATPLADVLPYYLDADATLNRGGWPQGGQTVTDLPNHHLQYAITWYALAAGLAGVYIAYVRRRKGPR
jgi:surfeit locus 1 family protein